MDLLEKIEQQKQRITKMFTQLSSADRSLNQMFEGSKYTYRSVATVEFVEGVQVDQQVTVQIPDDHDVYVRRLSVYPSRKFFSTNTAVPDDQTFRPCVFSSGAMVANPFIEDDPAMLDLLISISETFQGANGQRIARDLQNSPIPSQLFFSDDRNYRNNGAVPLATFDVGKGLLFEYDWFLPRSSSVTFKVSPQFASILSDPAAPGSDQTEKNRYRVDIVLSGFKKDA